MVVLPLLEHFFFFKQKTAYEIGVRLVGSEMCIRDRPWRVTFSYARAIQAAALAAWQGDDANLADAQKILIDRASRCSKASVGEL